MTYLRPAEGLVVAARLQLLESVWWQQEEHNDIDRPSDG